MRFFLFSAVVTLILTWIQYYLFRGIVQWTREKNLPDLIRKSVTAAFIIFNLPLPVAVLLRIMSISMHEVIHPEALIPVYLWHFVSFVLFLVLVLGQIIKLPFLTLGWILSRIGKTSDMLRSLKSDGRIQKFDHRRRQVIRHSLTVLTGSLAFGSAFEVYRKDTFETTDILLPISNLPDSFDNFSIGFISDIHSGIFMSAERMRSYAEAVNALGTDLIVVTGDFVNSDLNEVYPLADAFRILDAPYGVFGVLGNHDYYTRRVDEVAAQINKSGIELLRNTSLALRKGGDEIILAGIDDTGSVEKATRTFHETYRREAANVPQILLNHRPYHFRAAAAAGFDLMLAGHTHGGQVVLGELGRDVVAPARIVSPYVAGLYHEERSAMYVSRGIGTVGVPFRFNCPPEITRIKLTKSSPA